MKGWEPGPHAYPSHHSAEKHGSPGSLMEYGRIRDQEYWNCDVQNLEHAMLRGAPPFDSLSPLGQLTDQLVQFAGEAVVVRMASIRNRDQSGCNGHVPHIGQIEYSFRLYTPSIMACPCNGRTASAHGTRYQYSCLHYFVRLRFSSSGSTVPHTQRPQVPSRAQAASTPMTSTPPASRSSSPVSCCTTRAASGPRRSR